MEVVLILFLLGIPLLTKYLCAKFKVFEILGPVVVCYLFGILAVNLKAPFVNPEIAETAMQGAVPLAIILLLFSSDLSVWKKVAGGAGISFLIMVISVVIASVSGYFIFHNQIENAHLLAGMFTGVYTGGTPNMAAVAVALDAPPELFGLLNMYDVVLGGGYLLFVMTAGRWVYGKFLPVKNPQEQTGLIDDPSQVKPEIKGVVWSLLLAIAILGVSVGGSLWIFGNMNAGFIIPFITITAVGASQFSVVKSWKGSFATGDFFLLIFGTAMGLMSDFSKFSEDGLDLALNMGFVLLVSLVLHLLFSTLLKLDRDTVLITASAGIMSSPFVPAIARSIKNNAVILPGIAAGILGNAVGNLLGIFIGKMLGG